MKQNTKQILLSLALKVILIEIKLIQINFLAPLADIFLV